MKNTVKVSFGVMVLWLGIMQVVFLPGVGGAIPQKINYQGYLTNAAGVPINGTFQMVFGLYNSPSSPTPLWTEQQSVPVINGIYNVALGDVTPIPLPFDVPYYLGIQVGADPEMTPRKALTSVGYAFRAMTADVVGAHTHSGADITSGVILEARIDPLIARDSEVTGAVNAHAQRTDNPHFTTAAQVGAVPVNAANSVTSLMISDGTISPVDLGFSYAGSSTKGGPASDLNCPGCVSSGDLADAAVTKGKFSAAGGTSGQVLGTDGANLAWQSASTGVGWVDDGASVTLETSTDRVGIGTSTPGEELHVKGSGYLQGIFESTDSSGGIQLVSGPPGPPQFPPPPGVKYELQALKDGGFILYDRTNERYVMKVDDTGNVGIGTTIPEVKLDVNGWIKARNGYGDAISIGGDSVGDDLEINIYPTVDWVNTVSFWNGRTGVPSNIKVNEVQFSDGTRVASYRGFPRPNFDSGWNTIDPESDFTLSHNLGGDVNNYFVDLQFKSGTSINNRGIGVDLNGIFSVGAFYKFLTTTQITVHRTADDNVVEQFRVRIWKYE